MQRWLVSRVKAYDLADIAERRNETRLPIKGVILGLKGGIGNQEEEGIMEADIADCREAVWKLVYIAFSVTQSEALSRKDASSRNGCLLATDRIA